MLFVHLIVSSSRVMKRFLFKRSTVIWRRSFCLAYGKSQPVMIFRSLNSLKQNLEQFILLYSLYINCTLNVFNLSSNCTVAMNHWISRQRPIIAVTELNRIYSPGHETRQLIFKFFWYSIQSWWERIKSKREKCVLNFV